MQSSSPKYLGSYHKEHAREGPQRYTLIRIKLFIEYHFQSIIKVFYCSKKAEKESIFSTAQKTLWNETVLIQDGLNYLTFILLLLIYIISYNAVKRDTTKIMLFGQDTLKSTTCFSLIKTYTFGIMHTHTRELWCTH